MAKTKTKSGSKVQAACTICGKVVTKAGMVGHMSWKHGKQYKAPMLPSKGMVRAEERRKAELWDIEDRRYKAIWSAVDEINKAHKAGEHGEPFKAHIGKVAARLADSNNVSNNEALKLIHKTIVEEQSGKITVRDIWPLFKPSLSGRRKRQP